MVHSTILGLILIAGGVTDSRRITYYNGNLGPVFAFYGPERAVRFHPPDFELSYPFEISALMVEFYGAMGSFEDSMFWFKIYAGDGATLLYQSETLWATRRNLDSVYLLHPPVRIDSGDFYASLLSRTVTPWAKPYINYDDNPVPEHSFYGSPGAWQQWVDGGEYYFCAYVDTQMTGIGEKHRRLTPATDAVLPVPNPCAGDVALRFATDSPGVLIISDGAGRVVATMTKQPGERELRRNIAALPEGVYFLQLFSEHNPGHQSPAKLVLRR